MNAKNLSIRDSFLLRTHELMSSDSNIILLTVDMGAPLLDPIREDFPDQIINIGIAEQNAINVAAGLAIEGYKILVYGIAAFIFSRAFEQIKVSLSMNANFYNDMNVTLLGVGSGLSYELSGPPHHAIEDVSVLNMIPGIQIYSPSSAELSYNLCNQMINYPGIKYVRLDSGNLKGIPHEKVTLNTDDLQMINKSDRVAVLATGPMIDIMNDIIESSNLSCTLIAFNKLNNHDREEIQSLLRNYTTIVFAEECYQNKSILQIELEQLIQNFSPQIRIKCISLNNRFFFMTGTRSYLHDQAGMGKDRITKILEELL